MERIIIIEKCDWCPFNVSDYCRKMLRHITAFNQHTLFPDFCPLPEKKEDKEEQK